MAKFNLSETETKEFEIESDDGSCLYIDGQLLIDHWGVHPYSGKRATVVLTPGVHSIYVRYVNYGSGALLKLKSKNQIGDFKTVGGPGYLPTKNFE